MKNLIFTFSLILFLVQNSFSQCQPTFNFFQYTCALDCGLYLEDMSYNPDLNYDEAVLWNFGDGSEEMGSYFATQHQYASAGTYLVTVEILVGECSGMSYTYEFVVEGCNCPTTISSFIEDIDWNEYYSTQCSSYIFTLGGDDFVYYSSPNTTAEWDFGDGTTGVTNNNQSYHAFETEGEYIITCTYSSDFCPGVTLTDTIIVEFCDGDCAPFEYFEVYQYPDDCNSVQLILDFDPSTMWYVDDEFVGQGYSVDVVLETGVHDVCMVIEEQLGCPFGSEYCTEISIECNDDCPLEEDFEAIQSLDNCLLWEFELGDYVDDMNVEWIISDGTTVTGANYLEHLFAEPGLYTITINYESPLCPNEQNYVYTILIEEDCGSACELDISYVIETCEYYIFSAETNGISEVSWFYDEEYIGSGMTIGVPFPTEGEHTICATGGTIDCTLQVCENVFIDYTNCLGQCEIFVTTINNNCETTLISSVAPNEGVVEWYIDGIYYGTELSTVFVGENNTEHYYCAMYTPIYCDYITEACGVFMSNCFDCYIEIEAEQMSCDIYDFEAFTSPNDSLNTIQWYLDGEFIGLGSTFDDYNLSEGEHSICAVTESGLCYTESCIIITIENCEECTTVDMSIDSYVEEGGPSEISWMVFNLYGESDDINGLCTYDEGNMYCDATMCLPDGCYQMVLLSPNEMDWSTITSFPSIGGIPLEIYNVNICGCNAITYDFSINSDCGEDECYLDIQSEITEDGIYIFTANAPEDAIIDWSMGDGTTLNGQIVNHQYDEPGTYEVCATYETPSCPSGVMECMTILVEESNCTEVTISFSADVTDTQLELLEFYIMSEGFEYEGELPFTSFNGSYEMTYCIPDGCYEFMLVPADGLFDLLNFSIEASINGNVIASLEDIAGTEPVSMTIPVNSNCVVSVDQLETQNFEIYPNPAKDRILVTTTTNEPQTLNIYNSLGELVLTKNIIEQTQTVDISKLAEGIYQVSLMSANGLLTRSILIER